MKLKDHNECFQQKIYLCEKYERYDWWVKKMILIQKTYHLKFQHKSN
jgi:hypothetical protein